MRRKWLAVGIILLFIGVAIIPSTAQNTVKSSSPSRGTTLYVGGSGPGNYTRIQDAIDNASDGDTVFVFAGLYMENVFVNKSLILIGENREITIVDANGTNSTIVLGASGITINGFTIQHSGINLDKAGIKIRQSASLVDNICITNNIIKENWHAIDVYYSKNNTFSDNIIKDNLEHGIYSQNELCNSTISNNSIEGNQFGVFLYGSSNNLIRDNMIERCATSGIYLWASDSNLITSNYIANNEYGINVGDSSNNIIYNNNISNNELGISIGNAPVTMVKKNNFIDNIIHASFSYHFKIYILNFGQLARWWRNYWSNNSGLMKIEGDVYFIIDEYEQQYIHIPWCQFDFLPVKTPYDIPRNDLNNL
jgi:parallel beta-helix repeat protein